jgi:uncharacterized membrane protein
LTKYFTFRHPDAEPSTAMAYNLTTSIEASPDQPGLAWAPPRWASPTIVVLALGGLAVSTYLTVVHYASTVALACPDTGVINCEKVTTSPQSVIFGLPVAVVGMVFFTLMVVVNVPRAWDRADRPLRLARLGLAVSGVSFVLYLIYTELFTLHAICLWCTSAHVLALSIFAVIAFAESLARPE